MHASVSLDEPIRRLVEDIQGRPLAPTAAYEWPAASLNVIDCVLSLNRHYERFALPRVRTFAQQRAEVRTLGQLLELIRSYESPFEFGKGELSYRHADRMRVLVQVTERLLEKVAPDEEDLGLRSWANSATPEHYRDFGVKGFGIAGFQYLRMLFGAQTFKPDVHIVGHVVEKTGQSCSPAVALRLLEAAAREAGVNAKDLDYSIWLERSGSTPFAATVPLSNS